MNVAWVTVVETEWFLRTAPKVLSADEVDQLIVYLAMNPSAGFPEPGEFASCGGGRKERAREVAPV
jgi:hypothetical protein